MFPVFRRFVALLLALALLAPASAFGRVLYACSMSGKVSAGPCCCHKARVANAHAEHEAEPSPARAERPDCCEAQQQQHASAVRAPGTVELQVLAAAPIALLPALEPYEVASGLLKPSAHAARGPPHALAVYVTNCSLLI